MDRGGGEGLSGRSFATENLLWKLKGGEDGEDGEEVWTTTCTT